VAATANSEPTQWYESTLLWGAGSVFVAILLTVVAAMSKDVRWLLVFAWPLFGIAAWAVSRRLTTRQFWQWVATVGSSLIVAGLLIGLDVKLKPVEIARAGPTISAPSPKTAPPERCDESIHGLLVEYADKYPSERTGLLNGNLRPPTRLDQRRTETARESLRIGIIFDDNRFLAATSIAQERRDYNWRHY
jgi:hypothetical protein